MSKSNEDHIKLNQFETSNLPLHGIAVDYAKGHIIAPHSHAHSAQLLYAISGTLLIETQEGRWLVPPNRAVWLPAKQEHTVIMRSQCQVRSLLIKTNDTSTALPNKSYVINITPTILARWCNGLMSYIYPPKPSSANLCN